MAKYVFPAIFTQDGKQYSVRFPDVPGAITCGDDLKDAYQMAEDALALVLMDVEDGGERIPEPTNPNDIKKGEGEIVSLVYADTEEYRKSMEESLESAAPVPQWYLVMEDNRIIGGAGVIQNDFHKRKDMDGNTCVW